MTPPLRLDVHQHFWTEPLLDALAARRRLPYLARSGGVTLLHSEGEQPYAIDPAASSPEARLRLLDRDGLAGAMIAISSPVGIEALPREEAGPLIEAHLQGVAALPSRFLAWGAVPLQDATAADVDAVLARGCAGISLPAGALGGPQCLEEIHPVLARLAERGAPLFVHPGRAAGQRPARATFGEPLWWRALTDYVAQMQAAWLAFAAFGRREHPRLRVLFAMLAGTAPLASERLAARGGPAVELRDPLTFYETSSYGPAAVEMMARRVGASQLLLGSDRPVAEPQSSGREPLLAERAGEFLRGGAAPLASLPGAPR